MFVTLRVIVPFVLAAFLSEASENEKNQSGNAKIKKEAPSSKDMKEMEVKDIYMSLQDGTNVVILKTVNDGLYLPIWIGETEAIAIQLRLYRRHAQRPLTHDLLDDMLKSFNATVVKVEIDDLRDQVYLGRVFVKQGDNVIEFDARPSDSIALALGAKAPIYAARKVLDAAGVTEKALKQQMKKQEEDTEKQQELLRTKEKGQAL